MKKLLNRKVNKNTESGAAALEFALIVPVLLLLVLGLIDIGRLLLVDMSLLSAAQQGARVSAMTANSTAGSASIISSSVSNSVPSAIIQLGLLSDISTCTGTTTASCILPVAVTTCPGTNSGTTTISAKMSFKWLTPLELIWRFAVSQRTSTFTNLTQTVTAQCLV